jgi:hypothetical protein
MGIDPKRQTCQCGYSFIPSTWQKIIMLVRGEYVKRCPRCQCKLTLVLYSMVDCKKRENVDKRELWKRG